MLHHWTCLPALSVLQGKSIWKHILISIELPCNLRHITLQSTSYYTAIYVILHCNLRHVTACFESKQVVICM